jgi:type I restriction enzyme S subunit
MLNWRLPLPAVEDQRRIVDILEDHLSRLDAANEGIRLAEARLAALSRSWMDGLIWNSRSALVTVSELLAEPMRNGYSARASANGRIRIATLTAVTRRSFTDANSKLTDADPDRVKDLWLEPGDVLVQRANTPELVGSSALYDGARDWAVFPDLLIRLRPNKERVDPAYLCLALQTERLHRTLRGRAKGLAGSMPKVDQAAIGSLLIPVRPIGEQTAIIQRASAHAERADALLRAIQHAGQRSDTLRRALLAAAFSGRLTGRSSDLDRAEEMASA